MKYSDVVQIPPPLEDVKQVRDSATLDAARTDVETYVISDRMAQQLAEVVLPNLRFDAPGNRPRASSSSAPTAPARPTSWRW